MAAAKRLPSLPYENLIMENIINAFGINQQQRNNFYPPSFNTSPGVTTSMSNPKFKNGDLVRVVTDPVTLFRIDRCEAYGTTINYLVTNVANNINNVFPESILTPAANNNSSSPTQSTTSDPKTVVNFDSVIIDDDKRDQILEALEQINQTDLIFEKWGFGETIEKGRGVSLLFFGPPGTGKTLMAQAIAHRLRRSLSVISTADIESSAPGEAERNIRKHFKDAKEKDTILLFDECDSLIYTRQNVGPILGAQINELLSQIEKFNGITIFTTNRLGTLDEAVNRRLALKLEFDMPTVEQRVLIWQRMFPKKCPIDKDVDWAKLAIVEITGGYIKNAVLRAARMAAIEPKPDKQKKISMVHLVKALRLETQSMIDFESAREDQKSGMGQVGINGNGQRVIKRTQGVQTGVSRG